MKRLADYLTHVADTLCVRHGFVSWQSDYLARPLLYLADLLDPVV